MKKVDFVLLLNVFCLVFFGLLMIYDASFFIAFRDFGDKYHYIKDQFVWVLLGCIALTFFSFFDYHKFYTLSVPILISAIGLLIAVFIPGLGIYRLGAQRWIDVGIVSLQPAEYVKLALAIYLSAWFSTKEKKRFTAFALLMGVILTLVMLEPDMGTAIIILSEALIIYFLSGGKILYFFLMIPVLSIVGYLLIKLEPYRAARLATFLNSSSSLETSSYHVRQILIALGMGGIWGVGIGNSIQKYAYLPENTTDSIFAIIAEELGFVGASVLIIMYAILIWRGFLIAMHARDGFGKLLGGGVTAFLGIQVIINLGAQTTLLPLTGVPLPFISYGGSALIVDMTAIGILINIARQRV